MKKLQFSLLLIFFLNTALAEVASSPSGTDTIITNIEKDCGIASNKNITDYKICNYWKLLSATNILEIIRTADTCSDHTLHYAATEFPFWITAEMSTADKKYTVRINAGSYFIINDLSAKTSRLYCNKAQSCRKYFIANIGAEDDSLYLQIKKDALAQSNSKIKTKVKQGKYYYTNAKDSTPYVINFSLAAGSISSGSDVLACKPVLLDQNTVAFFADADNILPAAFSGINSGDYLFTLTTGEGFYFIQSQRIGSGVVKSSKRGKCHQKKLKAKKTDA